MKSIKEYSQIINRAIAALDYPEPKSLYAPIAYTMEGEGKRLRPVLTLAVADAFGALTPQVIAPALAVELYHNFTLLHDDIMDNSPTRRGRPAVWKKWDTATAILSGDTMLSVALRQITDADFDSMTLLELVKCFNVTALAVDHGQQLDMDFEHTDDVSLDDYLNMISLKTGALIAGACEMGAICGYADGHERKAFHDYGMNLGIAFQIQDDILDVYGDECTLGKPIGGDIINDKHTWLHIIASDEARGEMDAVRQGNLTDNSKIETVRAIYDNLNLRRRSDGSVGHYLDKAIDALRSITLDDDAHQFFVDLAHSLIGRKR